MSLTHWRGAFALGENVSGACEVTQPTADGGHWAVKALVEQMRTIAPAVDARSLVRVERQAGSGAWERWPC